MSEWISVEFAVPALCGESESHTVLALTESGVMLPCDYDHDRRAWRVSGLPLVFGPDVGELPYISCVTHWMRLPKWPEDK